MTPGDDHSRLGTLLRLALAFMGAFARSAGRRLGAGAAYVAMGAVLEGVGLVLVVPLLGIVIAPHGHGRFETAARMAFEGLGLSTPFEQLGLLLGLFSLLMILRALVIRTRDILLSRLRVGFVEATRAGIMERLAAARWDQVVALRHARISHLMSDDIQRLGSASFFLLQVGTSLAMLSVQIVLAFLLSPPLALVALLLVALAGVALIPILRHAGGLGGYVTAANLKLLDISAQFMGGLKLAISQNLQARFVDEFRATSVALAERQIENLRRNTYSRLALTTVTALAGAALVLIGYGWFALSPPVLIAVLLVVSRMAGPVGQVQQGLQQLAFALPAFGAVKALERELEAIGASVPTRPGSFPEGSIVFEDVRFRHGGGEDARGLETLSLTIAPGEFLGVHGPSGAGKTTFADLLVGLYPPQEGRITVGGAVLEGAVLQGWRQNLAYVSQDSFLFHDSVRRNLAWAAPDAREAQMWEALAIAGVDDLVRAMPQGLDTIVGERGSLVSGGERQRIALARALLRRPRLLVLDEATSAIDVAAEQDILQRLAALAPRPTIVLIAHRRESIASCDRVIGFSPGATGTGGGQPG